MIVRFVDTGRIDDHHCSNLIFITSIMDSETCCSNFQKYFKKKNRLTFKLHNFRLDLERFHFIMLSQLIKVIGLKIQRFSLYLDYIPSKVAHIHNNVSTCKVGLVCSGVNNLCNTQIAKIYDSLE